MLVAKMADSSLALSRVHPLWFKALPREFEAAASIVESLEGLFAPDTADIFRAFELSPESVKVLLIGQDPYPTAGNATGLAFSVNRNSNLPKSLQNIFTELSSDLATPLRTDGNLSDWQSQGVLLLNRILTAPIGYPLGHKNLGWEHFTNSIISYLAKRDVVALLMGNSARELKGSFKFYVECAHPSPLSAYRGFFGSKPFSKINELLKESGQEPIKW